MGTPGNKGFMGRFYNLSFFIGLGKSTYHLDLECSVTQSLSQYTIPQASALSIRDEK